MPSANEHEALECPRASESKSPWLQQSIEITYSLIRAHSSRTVWTLLCVSACMLCLSLHVYYEAPLPCDAGSSASGLLFTACCVNWAKGVHTSHKVLHLSCHFHSRLTTTNPSALPQLFRKTTLSGCYWQNKKKLVLFVLFMLLESAWCGSSVLTLWTLKRLKSIQLF